MRILCFPYGQNKNGTHITAGPTMSYSYVVIGPLPWPYFCFSSFILLRYHLSLLRSLSAD